ncbi:MAG TPA: decarboxylating 6-phosphogluconate dehydrogenase [Polyangiaceae bacterium]|nr:decarboxylating 6-phosphogluconate dehydrogenase [Polyangiaceae bacterium]
MQIGMIGLGRMGANMVRRLMRAGHTPVVYDVSKEAIATLVREGAEGATTLSEFAKKLQKPRAVWLMVPAAHVDSTVRALSAELESGDVVIDGGNSHYHDDLRRAHDLAARGIGYLDVGTSGGVHGLERGYCLMIGGDSAAVNRLDPIFAALAPGATDDAPTTAIPQGDASHTNAMATAARGYLHCGPLGAGHFVKMIHNGIEYGLMAAYAEGLNILRHANAGHQTREKDAETTPLSHPEHYQYDFDLAAITELWKHGSVISSWLLDLTADALAKSPRLEEFGGNVSDSGEGRWTVQAAIDIGVPAHVLSASLFDRFASRMQGDFANRVLSAMRLGFGGHHEKKST